LQDFYDICTKKQNKEIEISWEDIAFTYGFKDGETARQNWKKHRKKIGLLESKDSQNVLIISDQHIPFHLDNLLDVYSTYKDKVDILVFNGDEQDCQSISKFQKKYRLPFVDELIQTREFIIKTINIIKPKKIFLNYGNHNKRFITYMSDRLNEDILELMPDTNLELIIEDGFYKKDRFNGTKTHYDPLNNIIKNIEYTHNWYNQIGDMVICHPSAYKSGILKTAKQAWLYFMQKGFIFNCLILSHTHASGFFKYGDGYIFEIGSSCKEMDYIKEGRLSRPQSNGMFYCILEDGKFNYNKSKLIVL